MTSKVISQNLHNLDKDGIMIEEPDHVKEYLWSDDHIKYLEEIDKQNRENTKGK